MAPNVHVIGIVTMGLPKQPSVSLASSIGQSFGLIGALVDAGLESKRENTFEKFVKDAQFDPRTRLDQDLTNGLRAEGYEVRDIALKERDMSPVKVFPPASETGVDAYLDIISTYGYIAAGIGKSTPYRPFVYLHCRLVRATNGKVLMDETILYDPVTNAPYIYAMPKAVTLSPDPAYVFVDFDAIEADPKKAVEGLAAALDASASQTAVLLQ